LKFYFRCNDFSFEFFHKNSGSYDFAISKNKNFYFKGNSLKTIPYMSKKKFEKDILNDNKELLFFISQNFFLKFKGFDTFDPFFFFSLIGSFIFSDVNIYKQFRSNNLFDGSFFFKEIDFSTFLLRCGVDEVFFYRTLNQLGSANNNNIPLINFLHHFPQYSYHVDDRFCHILPNSLMDSIDKINNEFYDFFFYDKIVDEALFDFFFEIESILG
jgi:hypothetical protein